MFTPLNNSDSLLFGINNLIIPQWYYSVTKSYLIYTMYNSDNVIYLTFNKFVKCEVNNSYSTLCDSKNSNTTSQAIKTQYQFVLSLISQICET